MINFSTNIKIKKYSHFTETRNVLSIKFIIFENIYYTLFSVLNKILY